MRYQFIYPEDNQILGASMSTNVGATTVQGEIAFRPDFPLATPASSQINQMADASGATQMLNWVAYTGINALGSNHSTSANNAATDLTGDQLQALLWLTQTGTDLALSDPRAYENAEETSSVLHCLQFQKLQLKLVTTTVHHLLNMMFYH